MTVNSFLGPSQRTSQTSWVTARRTLSGKSKSRIAEYAVKAVCASEEMSPVGSRSQASTRCSALPPATCVTSGKANDCGNARGDLY